MKRSKVFLAVDLGAESGRVMAGAFDGERLRMEEARRFPNLPARTGNTLYWDALRLWNEIQAGIAQAAQTWGESLTSIGVDTWGVDFALLDSRGELVSNPVHYRDTRTEGCMESLFQRVPREQVFEQTGIQFMRLNTLYQLESLARGNAPALKIAQRLLFMPDLFHYWLSGEAENEFSISSTSQCYDPRAGNWSSTLLQSVGIPSDWFGEVQPPGTVLGDLQDSIRSETGAPPMKVVLPASHDTGSAVAATPLQGAHDAYLSSGTWSLLGVEVPQPVINADALEANVTNEGGAFGTFRLLKNVMGLWLLQGCRRAWAKAGRDYSYVDICAMAERAVPFLCWVDPENESLFAPDDMPAAIQAFCQRTGQPVPESEGQIARCALESLALKYRHVLRQLERLSGRSLRVLHIVGGGSQNRLLNQWTANATGLETFAGPVEATAAGNALLQAVGLGDLKGSSDLREVVRRSFPQEVYTPVEMRAWEESYERWLTFTQTR